MADAAKSVTLDEDVETELRELAASIERGLGDLEAGRTMTTDEVLAHLREQRRTRIARSIG